MRNNKNGCGPRQPRSLKSEQPWVLRTWGITPEQHAALLASQNKVCAICQQPPEEDKPLHIDHCHEQMLIRGLLCQRCNTALGLFKDDVAALLRAASYVQQTTTLPVGGYQRNRKKKRRSETNA
jgi:hypothetical protein